MKVMCYLAGKGFGGVLPKQRSGVIVVKAILWVLVPYS